MFSSLEELADILHGETPSRHPSYMVGTSLYHTQRLNKPKSEKLNRPGKTGRSVSAKANARRSILRVCQKSHHLPRSNVMDATRPFYVVDRLRVSCMSGVIGFVPILKVGGSRDHC